VLRQWGADQRSPHIVLEARAADGKVSYLVGAKRGVINDVTAPLKLIGATPVKFEGKRLPVGTAVYLKASTRHRPLRSDFPEPIVRSVLGALTRARRDELLVLQIVLGPRRTPLAIPNQSPSSVVMPWWQVAWIGNGGTVDPEKRAALRTKVASHGFAVTIRIGSTAATPERRRALILGALAAVRTTETAGLQLRAAGDQTARLDGANAPWRWPLRLGAPELAALTAWPIGDGDLPGQPAAHPRPLAPAPGTTGKVRVLAEATAAADRKLVLSAKDALHHLHVVGPTGTGKSTMLTHLICEDIATDRGVIVIEPKDLVDDVLSHMPASRLKDVVVLDPSDPAPVGLNPLSTHGRRPELVADGVLAIFRQLYGSAIGPRTADILYAALLTLAQRPDASLTMLPLLLANPGFRRSLTAGLHDPLVLGPFWATFDNWTEAERANAIAPAMNKLRPLLRPGLRGVLGQRSPRFHVSQVFTERKILLVPLRRGVIGSEAAKLLGSLVVAEVWSAIQARADIPAARRHPVMITIDEVQDYLNFGTDLGEALAQARGFGAGFTLAHQFLGQLPKEMRSATLANARSRVLFQLPHEDAVTFAKGHAELSPVDFTSLPQYEIYASLFTGGQVTPYASGRTLPPTPVLRDAEDVRRLSRERYGQPLDVIEADFAALAEPTDPADAAPGRRRRQP
jgi:hypothetical protein